MARPRVMEHRFDFRGGRNCHTSPVLLEPNEMPDLTNVTLDAQDGALKLRPGSRRLHTTALGAPSSISGVFQWENGGTPQLLAVSNGDLYHRTGSDFGEYTAHSPTPVIGTGAATWTTMRDADSGAPLYVYFSDGGAGHWRWTGSAATDIDGVSGMSPAKLITTYHLRNFWVTPNFPSHVYWTVLADPEDATAGLRELGGSAMIDVLRGQEITALEVLGSSLLVGTKDSIVRFTGYDATDIQIEQDTEGLSHTFGPLGPYCMTRAEDVAFVLSKLGIYGITEREHRFLSEKWNCYWRQQLDKDALASACVAYHEGRREIWVAVPGTSDGGLNKRVMVYHMDLGVWYGPYVYSFGMNALGRFVAADGEEYIMAGCSDGFVRVLNYDTSGLDDVLAAGTGGSSITASVTFAPTFFDQVGPGIDKVLREVTVHATMGTTGGVTVELSVDQADWVTLGTVGPATGTQYNSAPWALDANAKGDRFQLRMSWTDPTIEVRGYSLRGHSMERPGTS